MRVRRRKALTEWLMWVHGGVINNATLLWIESTLVFEGPINQVRKEAVKVPAASRRSHEISSTIRRA